MKKLAVIIGAGPGLGQAIAEKFGSQGFEIVLVARNKEKLAEMCSNLTNSGVNAYFKTADASDSKSLSAVTEEIKSEYGAPDCIVYNAGITSPDVPGLDADILIEHFKTDVAGAMTTVNGFADEALAEKRGAIIFTGGALATYPADGFIPLSINKAALRALAYILNGKYKDKGIFVGTVTIYGTINACDFLSAKNIAEMYWQMYEKRDRCEYAYQFPELAPEILYKDHEVSYGMFEDNTANYWGEVYKNITKETK